MAAERKAFQEVGKWVGFCNWKSVYTPENRRDFIPSWHLDRSNFCGRLLLVVLWVQADSVSFVDMTSLFPLLEIHAEHPTKWLWRGSGGTAFEAMPVPDASPEQAGSLQLFCWPSGTVETAVPRRTIWALQCFVGHQHMGQRAQPLARSLKGVGLQQFFRTVSAFKSKGAALPCKQFSLLSLCFVEAAPIVNRFNRAAGGWPWGPGVFQLEKLGNLKRIRTDHAFKELCTYDHFSAPSSSRSSTIHQDIQNKCKVENLGQHEQQHVDKRSANSKRHFYEQWPGTRSKERKWLKWISKTNMGDRMWQVIFII